MEEEEYQLYNAQNRFSRLLLPKDGNSCGEDISSDPLSRGTEENDLLHRKATVEGRTGNFLVAKKISTVSGALGKKE
jgi:hypothetical protein